MTLIEKIQHAVAYTKQEMKERPEVTDIWFEFNDCELGDLREVAKHYKTEVEFVQSQSMMRVMLNIGKSVIFCRSPKMKVETHFVVDNVIKNI